MSVEAMAIVLHHSRAKGTAKLVLLGIANHEGDGGAWPSVSTLAKYAGVDVRNVQRALRQLEQLGELHTDRQAGGDHLALDTERPNLYRVTVSCPSDCDRSTKHRTAREQRALALGWMPRTPDSQPVDNRVAPAPGGGASVTGGGGASVTGGGGASVTQTTQGTIHRTSAVPAPPTSGGCCVDGWAGEDEDGRPVPCPVHRAATADRIARRRAEG